MPDEMKGTTQKRKPTPKPPTPEQTRQQLLEAVASDFTYKSNFSDEQMNAWNWVQGNFKQFNADMQRLLDFSKIRKRLTITDDYKAFTNSSRVAERRANAAIANDWNDSAFDVDSAEGIEYPIKERDPSSITEQDRLCDEVSKACFELTIKFMAHLPLGRYLSLFRTEMEAARGWLLDTINRN